MTRGNGVERERALLAGVVEGHALVEVGAGKGVGALLEECRVIAPEGVEHRLVRGARRGPRLGQHLVPNAAPEPVLVEEAAATGLGSLARSRDRTYGHA